MKKKLSLLLFSLLLVFVTACSSSDKKKGKEAVIEPKFTNGHFKYEIKYQNVASAAPRLGRGKFHCIHCKETTPSDYIKQEGKAKRIGYRLMAIVAEGKNGRIYLPANQEHIDASSCMLPELLPEGKMIGIHKEKIVIFIFI